MKVLVKEEVYADLIDIVRWYEIQSALTGIKFLNEWEKILKFVAQNPFAFQVKYKNFRHAKVPAFPYLVIFEIENSAVIVFAIIHASRKPGRRYKRK